MMQRNFSVDHAEYPFQSRWYARNGCYMHYVDEGEGDVVVMFHGNPTWSYSFRHIIKQLSSSHRCIAFDLPGFGFSEHPDNFGYTPQEHAAWVSAFLLEHLKLDKFVLVAQDWGGPISLDFARKHPEKIAGMLLSATFIGKPGRAERIFSALMGSWLGQYLILRHNFFAKRLLPLLMSKKPSPATLKAYTEQFPSPASRMGSARFPIHLVAATNWLEEIANGLNSLKEKPVEFIFGLDDLGSSPSSIKSWLKIFPDARIQKIENAGHYTQEECPENYVLAIRRLSESAQECGSCTRK